MAAPKRRLGRPNLLRDARVYLSGPMDFVASRADEKRNGWRTRVREFLRELGVTVFDPWLKPGVRGFHEYGYEGEGSTDARKTWTFERTPDGAAARAASAERYWSTLHVDLRMVDTSDFVIAYCPTNLYSVGTPHEIILCRQQHKPVLFVSPPVEFPTLDRLHTHLEDRDDREGVALLRRLETEVPIKPNPQGVPSLWYMPLIGSEHFFDGFGFAAYRDTFKWPAIRLDSQEARRPPTSPLLPFLIELNQKLPQRWDRRGQRHADDDDWILWDLQKMARET